jgi:hypothetical protein
VFYELQVHESPLTTTPTKEVRIVVKWHYVNFTIPVRKYRVGVIQASNIPQMAIRSALSQRVRVCGFQPDYSMYLATVLMVKRKVQSVCAVDVTKR